MSHPGIKLADFQSNDPDGLRFMQRPELFISLRTHPTQAPT